MKEIDADGKPTEFESKDMTGGEDTPDSDKPYALIDVLSKGTIVKSLNDKINNITFDINTSKILKAGARIQIFGR